MCIRCNALVRQLSADTAADPTMSKHIEDDYEAALQGLLDKIQRAAIEILKNGHARRGLEAAQPFTTPFPLSRYDPMLRQVIEYYVQHDGKQIVDTYAHQAYQQGGKWAAINLQGMGVSVELKRSPADWHALDVLQARNLAHLRGMTEDSSKKIISSLADGFNKGQGIAELSKGIIEAIDTTRSRATTIARTETMYAVNQGTLQRYHQVGIAKVQFLVGAGCCEECEEYATRDIGYGPGIYPIDEVPDIPVHPNCRCTVIPVIDDPGEQQYDTGDAGTGVDQPQFPTFDPQVIDYPPQPLPVIEPEPGAATLPKITTLKGFKNWMEKERLATVAMYPTARDGTRLFRYNDRSEKDVSRFTLPAAIKDQHIEAYAEVIRDLNKDYDHLNIPHLQGIVPRARNAAADMGDGIMGLNARTVERYTMRWGGNEYTPEQLQAMTAEAKATATAWYEKHKQLAAEGRFKESEAAYKKYKKADDLRWKLSITESGKYDASTYKLGSKSDNKPMVSREYFTTGRERAMSDVYHEGGHHIHQQLGTTVNQAYSYRGLYHAPMEERLDALYIKSQRANGGTEKISATIYSNKNSREWFAEHYALHKMGRDDLVPESLKELFKELGI